MSAIVPDTPFTTKSFWSTFTIRDAIYALIMAYMLMNQHFNNEQRMTNLELSSAQSASAIQKMSVKIDTEMVPRKEHDAAQTALSIRLGNIEQGQNNVMTYLLNHGR